MGYFTITRELYLLQAVLIWVKCRLEFGVMSGKTKILIVEDETPLAMMMVRLLSRAGCDVQTTGNAERSMQRAQSEDFDLITLDIDLPDRNGFEICRQLKEFPRSRKTPVVFVSGRPATEDRQRAFELGAVDYIVKPFEPTDYISRIKSHTKAGNNFASVPTTEGTVA